MRSRLNTVLAIIASVVIVFSVVTFQRNQAFMENMRMGQNDVNTNTDMNQGNSENTVPSSPFNNHDYAKGIVKPRDGQPVKRFTLVAQETNLEIKEGVIIPVWTYNGTVPGEEIRVTEGDYVQVELKNTLTEPVTIHWHGYPLNSAMDGVPGLNQDAVRPGETFVYEFSADVPGTYWYHSHQEGSKQVDKGLYGALIVEPKNKGKIDKDYTFILDEWMENPMEEMGNMNMEAEGSGGHGAMEPQGDTGGHGAMEPQGDVGGHGGMDMSTSEENDPVMEEEEMMAYAYDIYTVNGKSGELIKPIDVKKGDVVRLRFINAGYRSHGIHIPGQDIKIVSTDGQDIYGADFIKDQIIQIAPGERYDVEFTVTSDENFFIDAHDDNAYNDQLQIPVIVADGNGTTRPEEEIVEYPLFNLVNYGAPGPGKFTLDQTYDIDYMVQLDALGDDKGLRYTINGKIFNELPLLKLRTGNTVKFTYFNNSKVDHPMHLHGHFFQILSKNGIPVSGAAIMKDTLLVKPGEKYVVAFEADNPGRWVQHCHELHHAAAGMMQGIEYEDFVPNYTANPQDTYNKPE
ncbi:FtsP/CotA-like multicopper oxidase with cupredoxin domain [Anaerosolibacter carboniphilus]|uniref:FtsP/CotA-like multicopper oxidase with cupredoxin domain n=1 Tax=Anaerosolibacter carboniphilus TaxID=1417629 RepID=A0A841KWZ4_9FIRM|nr:multicopper oxidase family protein [Anaerosolibacter carboniphilus]MBB6215452.1 FtsP/CotA-like multicopper oxidase with cupredoxin domain [Anaerosolibacter carboniphilus]